MVCTENNRKNYCCFWQSFFSAFFLVIGFSIGFAPEKEDNSNFHPSKTKDDAATTRFFSKDSSELPVNIITKVFAAIYELFSASFLAISGPKSTAKLMSLHSLRHQERMLSKKTVLTTLHVHQGHPLFVCFDFEKARSNLFVFILNLKRF